MKHFRTTAVLLVGACILTILGGAFLTNGLKTLTAPGFGADLTARWRELRLVLNGVNPYDVSASVSERPPTPAEAMRLNKLDSGLVEPISSVGYPPSIGYPPWAFLTDMLLVYPGDFRITQYFFAAVNVAALGLILAWAFSVARPYGASAGLFLSASVLAIFGNASTLRLGQYGIICNALLVGMLLAEERQKQVPTGLAFALSALKPNFSALYFVILVVRQRKIAIAIAALYTIIASLLVGYLVHVSPIEMTLQMLRQSSAVVEGGVGPVNVLLDYQFPVSAVSIVFGLSGLVAGLLLITHWRNTSTLTLFSIAAVIGRLAFYHRQYDNVMLLFPLVALGLQMFEKPDIWRTGSFLIFACSLWIPLRYVDYTHTVQVSLAIIWIFGLCNILASSPRTEVKRVTMSHG
jgi:hypothetical protein